MSTGPAPHRPAPGIDAGPEGSYARHTDPQGSDHGPHTDPAHGRTPAMSTTAHPGTLGAAQLRRIDEIFAARGASLVRAAHALTGSRHDAEDLLQEAFMRAVARPGVFDGRSEGEAAAWLWIVMRRLWRDRQRGGLGRTSPMPAEVEQRLVDTAPPIPDQVLHDWELAVVYEGLARLGPRHRTAMILLGRGYGEVEAAELAGVSRRTMREWRRDARRALGVFGERLGAGTICAGVANHLSAYADGELGAGRARTHLEAHLTQCAACRADLERIRAHTRTLGAALPAAGAAAIADAHAIPPETVHIAQTIEVLAPPRIVIGGNDGLVAYAEAHWRLVATTAIVVLTGWAIVSNAVGHLTASTAAPRLPAAVAHRGIPSTRPPATHARTRDTARTSASAIRRPLDRGAASTGHLATLPAASVPVVQHASPGVVATCTSAACLFGP